MKLTIELTRTEDQRSDREMLVGLVSEIAHAYFQHESERIANRLKELRERWAARARRDDLLSEDQPDDNGEQAP